MTGRVKMSMTESQTEEPGAKCQASASQSKWGSSLGTPRVFACEDPGDLIPLKNGTL